MTVPDISGLIFPGLPGQGVDHLQAIRAGCCAAAAQRLLEAAGDDPIARPLCATLAALPPEAAASVFAHPLAPFDLGATSDDDIPDARPDKVRRTALARHLIGSPDVPELTLALTDTDLPADLLLPHLKLLLRAPRHRVVSVHQSGGRVRFMRDDGLAATFRAGTPAPPGVDLPLVASAPRVGSFDVLNADPAVAASLDAFDLAHGSDLAEAMGRLERGLRFLAAHWPVAADAMARHVRGVALLGSRSYERSHSPKALSGAIVMTTGAPVTVGDILCHEASHIRMHWAKAADPLIVARDPHEEEQGFDSPWRADKRPLDGLTLGVHAFLNVCSWYRRVAQGTSGDLARFARRVHDRQARNVRTGWTLLSEKGRSTAAGTILMEEFGKAVAALTNLDTAETDP
jgi:HEXXH motif-containing protein